MDIYDRIAELAETGHEEEACTLALPILQDTPNDPRILFLCGFIFAKSEKWGLAYQVLKRGVELNPNNAMMWHNLGKSCYEMRKYADAEACWSRAVKLEPKLCASLDGLALVNLRRSDHKRCIEYADRVLAMEPDNFDSLTNRGMACLGLYRWREGWEGYSKNIGRNRDRRERDYNGEPRWDGTKGLNVVCHSEQGIGDEFSFASCLPDLIRDSKSVTIECDRRSEGIMRRSFPTCEVFGTRYEKEITWNEGRKFDARVALGDLPRFYRNADAEFPGTPYFLASPEIRMQWRALFDRMGERPKIGLAWNGGSINTNTNRRSITLETLLPILKCDAEFISLEYRTPDADALKAGENKIVADIKAMRDKHGVNIHHWPHAVQSYDYDPTLALINELDLVIAVTTTVVHAAGAVGIPCWCLVPQQPMWRYGVKGAWFPWAKSVELFRQENGAWPVAEIAARLKGKFNATGDRQNAGENIRQVA